MLHEAEGDRPQRRQGTLYRRLERVATIDIPGIVQIHYLEQKKSSITELRSIMPPSMAATRENEDKAELPQEEVSRHASDCNLQAVKTTASSPSNDRNLRKDEISASDPSESNQQAQQVSEPPPSTASARTTQRLPNGDNSDPLTASPSFKGAKICVAIDVSASTYGDVLEAEKRATEAICKLIPAKLRPTIKIVPWNHACGRPVDLSDISSLYSDGGTDPTVFLEEATSRDFLQEADFWFLMTDGEIAETNVRTFARGLREYGLHGKACITCIFGERQAKPAECNVSVGISVFAGSPHAAFLFHDTEFGQTYVLQTKGCLSALLRPDETAPRLDNDTSWEDLPKTSFENLCRVHIPPAVTVGADEVILQDNTRLDISAFLRDLPEDEATIARILDNEENLNTIAISSKLRNETDRLRSWLDRLDAKYGDTEQEDTPKPQVEADRSSAKLSGLIDSTLANLSKTDTAANGHYYGNFSAQPTMPVVSGYDYTQASTYTVPVNAHSSSSSVNQHSRRASSYHMRRVSLGGFESAADNLSRPTQTYTLPSSGASNSIRSAPGFSKPNRPADKFKSLSGCLICKKQDEIMCLLIRSVSSSGTANFPGIGSHSTVLFPMAMGNYAEMDILVSEVVCDGCAANNLWNGRSKQGDQLIAVLPLVSFSENQTAWLETLSFATQKRFDTSQMPSVFLSILYIKLERLVHKHRHAFSDLSEGIKWAANLLLNEVLLKTSGYEELDKLGIGAMHDVLLRSFSSTRSDPSYIALLQYPIDGFVVANAALSNSKHSQKFSGMKRKNVVFLKFLYRLAENYFRFRAEHNTNAVEVAKSVLLLSDEPSGPISLFNWKEIHQISVKFNNPVELRKFFSQNRSYKLAVTVNDLKQTPFFPPEDLQAFQRLGVLFNWIKSQAGHAIAIFLHHLFRTDIQGASMQECFIELRKTAEVSVMLSDPADMSAKRADESTKRLPPL